MQTVTRRAKILGVVAAFAVMTWSRCLAEPGRVGTDSQVNAWIEAALQKDPRVAGAEITVTTVAGMVTLEGRAATLAARDYAALAALKIRGVLGVVNQIEFDAAPRDRARVTRELLRRLRSNELLGDTVNIHVDYTDDGAVHLIGDVPTETAAEEAYLLARQTPGVSSVSDDLELRHGETISDDDLVKAVRAVLRRDVYLTGAPIAVGIEAGVVTLSGEVTNPYAKQRAPILLSRLGRVRRVINDITVAPGADDGVRTQKPELSDEKIATYVEALLRRDNRVEASSVDVRVFSGHVSLSGAVPDARQRRFVVEGTKNTVGVASVTDDLVVRPLPENDATLRAAVVARLREAPSLAGLTLDATVDGGVVSLRGHVRSNYEKIKAGEVVMRVPGVVHLVNELVIDDQR